MIKLICMIGCLMPLSLLAQPKSNADQLYQEAQALLTNYRDGEAMVKYEEVVSVYPSHFQSLCQLVVLKTRIASRTSDEAKKTNYFHQAKEYAIKAFELKPNDAQANYVMALGIGGVALVSNTKQKIAYAYEMKRYLDRALQLNPKHAESWHLLGRWHYKISNLSLAEITAANLFFGGVPKGASMDEALDCMQKALEYNPKEILYHYDLARVYETMGDEGSCLDALRTALALPVTTSDEQEVKRRCRALMRQLED